MKQLLAFFLCLLLSCSCALTATAAQMDTLPESSGEPIAFFVIALILALGGGIYLFFMLKK